MNRIDGRQLERDLATGGFENVKCVNQLFEAQVHSTPDSVALICGESRLTYDALSHRANQLAHHLRGLGVGPETLVGICTERSVEMVVAVLGVFRAGGAYVPLDPAYPRERLKLMIGDSSPAVLLTQSHLQTEFGQSRAPIILLDKLSYKSSSGAVEDLIPGCSHGLAYVIYTSGSTGSPKGVMITHANLGHYARSMQQATGVTRSDVYLHTASISFSSSVRQLMLPLSVGATVVIASNAEIRDPIALFRTMKRLGVTVIDIVPSYWRSCIYALKGLSNVSRSELLSGNLRLILSASEPLLSDVPRAWRLELDHDAELINMFGQTETTGIVATHRIVSSDTEKVRIVSIGNPIRDVEINLLDSQMRPVGYGESGEICISGPTVGRGYLNRPDLTSERFVSDPFVFDPTARMYRTGDFARRLPSGEIEFLGRSDNQVKIRGYRIELAEIEAAVSSFPNVRECVAIAREDQPGEKKLAAYVVPEHDQQVEFRDLRAHLKQTLPDYMMPSSFVQLDQLPLTPNGKIDRRGLPAPASMLPESERPVSPPRDELEIQLARIWETILGVQPIRISDNFFDLGGHSLQAVQMFAEVEKTFGKSVPIATLFAAGTIERLGEILRQDEWSEPESSLVPIQPNGTRPPFFCVHAGGGNVLFYRDLARHLGPDQPFYGVQARRVGGRQVGHETVEEMAAYYIGEIRKLQPLGPYFIGGASFGGLAAFEMARQLHLQGCRVGLLALFDSGTPDYPRPLPGKTVLRSKLDHLVRRIQHHRDSLRMLNTRERVTYLLRKVEKVRRGYYRKLNDSYRKAGRAFYTLRNRPIPKNFIQIEDKIWRAGRKYVPQVYPGKATLFRSAIQPRGIFPDPALGWDGLVAGGLEIHEVPGQHAAIVTEPYVKALVEKFGPSLRAAQRDSQTEVAYVRTA